MFVIALKMAKVRLWRQARASIFAHQKYISLKIVVHISSAVKGVFQKKLKRMSHCVGIDSSTENA